MGCGSSSVEVRNSVIPLKKLSFPSIDVSNVRATEPNGGVSFIKDKPKVIFIFGGPGSSKGKIVASLVSVFNVQVISAETLILQSLPKKVQQVMTISTVQEMGQLVFNDSTHVQLNWVLSLIKAALSGTEANDLYIIDLIPSLKWLLKNECFMKDNCTTEMKEFEDKYPISFGIHLSVDEASLQTALAPYSQQASNLLIAGTSVNDEADNSRAKKRYTVHQNAMNPFIEYFQSSDRLLTLDMCTTSNSVNNIFHWLNQFMITKGLKELKPANIVFIFTNELIIGNLNLTDYDLMTVIHLKDIINDSTSLEDITSAIIEKVCTLRKDNCNINHFVIDTSDTSLLTKTATNLKTRSLTFTDTQQSSSTCIYQFTRQINSLVGGATPYFKSVCSSHDFTHLFPFTTDESLCENIILTINEHLQKINNKL